MKDLSKFAEDWVGDFLTLRHRHRQRQRQRQRQRHTHTHTHTQIVKLRLGLEESDSIQLILLNILGLELTKILTGNIMLMTSRSVNTSITYYHQFSTIFPYFALIYRSSSLQLFFKIGVLKKFVLKHEIAGLWILQNI